MRRIRPGALFWSIVAVDLLLMALVTASTLIPRRARLSIAAKTEIASVVLPAGQRSFAWGQVAIDPKSIDTLPQGCTAPSLDLEAPLEGPLAMDLRLAPATGLLSVALKRDGGNVGTVECQDGRRIDSGGFVRLLWPKSPERSLALRFMGYLTVGGDLAEGTPSLAMLREGTITVEAPSMPFRNGSVRTETQLYPGDIVQMFNSRDASRQAIAHGLLLAGADGLIEVVAHAEAREAHVIHVGQGEATSASVAPTFWAKLQAQSEWTLLILLGALILNILGALRSYREELAIEESLEGPIL